MKVTKKLTQTLDIEITQDEVIAAVIASRDIIFLGRLAIKAVSTLTRDDIDRLLEFTHQNRNAQLLRDWKSQLDG